MRRPTTTVIWSLSRRRQGQRAKGPKVEDKASQIENMAKFCHQSLHMDRSAAIYIMYKPAGLINCHVWKISRRVSRGTSEGPAPRPFKVLKVLKVRKVWKVWKAVECRSEDSSLTLLPKNLGTIATRACHGQPPPDAATKQFTGTESRSEVIP
jgi:hypothetical protein